MKTCVLKDVKALVYKKVLASFTKADEEIMVGML